jgi:hypothetical protein
MVKEILLFTLYLSSIVLGSFSDSLTCTLHTKATLSNLETLTIFFLLFLPRMTSKIEASNHIAFGATILLSQVVIRNMQPTKEERTEIKRDEEISKGNLLYLECKDLLHEYPLHPAYLEYEGMEF